MSVFGSITQNVVASTVNSSTANLASSATFTGTSESTLGIIAIQVNLFADQNCTIQAQQSQDGTNWDIIDSFTYQASSTGNDASKTLQATASFYRVLVTNNGGSSTTALRLQTALAPIGNVEPRSLTQLGNSKVAIVELSPQRLCYNAVTAAFTPAATPTDLFIIGGSATKVIRILDIRINGTATALTIADFFLIKRSTANSAGTFVASTLIPNDANDAAATATVGHYTANPTTGTAVGNVSRAKITLPIATSPISDISQNLLPSAGYGVGFTSKPITLRGTAQQLAINFNGVALPAGSASWYCSVTWTEDFN